MSTVRYIRILYILFAFLLGVPGEVWADLTTSNIIIDEGAKVGDTDKYTILYGSVTIKSVDSETRRVTITIKPDEGYYVLPADIIVQKLVDPGRADARRRVPKITETLTVSPNTRTDGPDEGDYWFDVPEDYDGALVTVTISGKNPASAVITPKTLTYNGTAQELVTLDGVTGAKFNGAVLDVDTPLAGYYTKSDDDYTPCSASGTADGTTTYYKPVVTYSLTENGSFSPAIPTRTDAGDYTVYYRVTGDGNYSNGIGSVAVTIQRAALTKVTLDQSVKKYTGSDVTFTIHEVKAGSVTASTEGIDYEVDDVNGDALTQTAEDTYTLKVNGLGNFRGTASTTFKILDEDVVIIDSSTDPYDITASNGTYILASDIPASKLANLYSTAFTGKLDGNSHIINMSGYNQALFNTINGGTVKNVTLQGVAISSSADAVGAIAGTAKGYSRIYNCGILPNSANFPEGTHPYVTTTGACAGGIVGRLENDSRVINCYSYADVSASTYAAGIVGNNTFASTAAVTNDKYANLRTAVVNCMFYGNITGGTNQYGVYGGSLITNAATTGINSYNYYSNGSTFTTTSGEPTAYNCSFPAEERYLTQVEFHRSLLNSNRELCGWWVGSNVAPSTLPTAEVQAIPKDASLMYKWVVDSEIAPYPILKPFGKYASIINNPGNQTGSALTVKVQSGSHSSASDQTLSIPITNMDPEHHDYGYYKVQLPYFNTVFGNPDGADWAEKYAGNYTDYVVTGWKITSVTTDGSVDSYNTFKAAWEDGYNFADRKCTDKDLYEVSGRVFAQGGYYYVPDGVIGITIEAYWGKAIYVRNNEASYDRVNITTSDKAVITGSHFAPAGTHDNNVNGATIQATSKLSDALTNANIPSKGTVYDYALVLVGNVQESVGKNNFKHATQDTRGFTIMSVDLDFDDEPDYCLEWQLGYSMGRQEIAPIRFDFLPVVELGIAEKLHNSTYFLSLGCYRSKGHFEVTETSFIRFGQFEFELQTRDEGPVILNGGIYDQYCRGRNNETNQHINYVILGGHVIMPSFTPGAHVNNTAKYQTRHCAVNALGGNFTSFYLTGGYNEGITPYQDNPHCYIDGGRFGTIAAAYKEGIWGDVTWRINHALIGEFYGGGVMSQATGNNYKIVKGNIDVVIDNSTVGKYCGGPKFGDMVAGKTVTTSATNTVFTQYFGAGNGGTNYVQYFNTDNTGAPIKDWSSTINSNYHVGQYRSDDQSYEANYDLEVINTSTGNQSNYVVNRSYYYSAQFATTNTGDVTNTLNNCEVLTNFYGGGNLGGVNGNITSTLTGTRVHGSVFGAGYSASVPEVTIYNKDKAAPSVNTNTGMIKPQSGGTSTTYTWTNDPSLSTSNPISADGKYFFTEVPLTNLGAVSGNVTLTVDGSSVVEGNEYTINTTDFSYSQTKKNVGGVFGGGDESSVTGTNKLVQVNINTTSENQTAQYINNVFGGGNNGDVASRTEVNVIGSSYVKNDVYGGGRGETTVVEGNVTVNIGTKTTTTTTDEPPVTTSTYAGKAIVGRNVYGGSALGNTNATKGATISHTDGTTTQVNLYGGAVTGSVFGGGLGRITPTPIASNVYGPVTVTVEGSASGEDVTAVTAGNVFGCNDQNGAPQSTVEVYIKGTAAATGEVANPIGNVYGGGNLAAYTGSPIVEMSGGTVGKVYGGGLGASAIITGNTSVLLSGGTVNQDVYGGGSEANVTGSVAVSITGGTVTHDVYGGGALANTNTATTVNEGKTVYPNTTVSLTGGTIDNVYGGGLGRKAATGVEEVVATSGNVLVELNRDVNSDTKGCVVNQLFGGNNLNGYPLGSTIVHVYKTQHKDKATILNKYALVPTKKTGETLKAYLGRLIEAGKPEGTLLTCISSDVMTSAETTYGKDSPTDEELNTAIANLKAELNNFYDVQAVYGGGNEADYVPADEKQSTEVIIEGCDLTSIKDVYGGGNAAAVPATEVWILGTQIIDNLFGGGNGERGDSYAAHVGFHRNNDLSTRDYEKGSGETHVKLVGGTINSVYGGSNSHGDIHGGANILMPTISEYNSTHEPDATSCTLITQHIYGGGKNADMSSGTNIVLGCMPDGWINEIYAGAQAADVAGNVSLTITSGKFGRVFGGNKDSGKLEGSITVNIEETGNCDAPIVIGELYGGGNMADYSVYGFNDDGSVKTSGDTQLYADPQVNVRAFTSIGAIYGGGYSALMVGNPSVDINVVKGSHAYNDAIHTETEGDDKYFPAGAYTNGSLSLPYPKHKEGEIGAIGNVFGGGNLANVIGNTEINIGTESTVDFVTPPMHLGESGVAYTFNETTQLYEGVSISGANITGSVYGGGNAADIIGNTTVIIGTVDLTDGGKSGTNIAGDVFGGGLGETTTVTGNVQVNIGKKIAATESTPESYEGYATISGDVYGGSAKGKVNATKSGTEPTITYAASSGTTEVNFYGGTITGDLYGGGYGLDNAKADVYGAITVNVYKGSTTNTAVTNVFGGNNLSGVTRNTIDVNISGGTVSQDVYGGGNVADALSNVTVTVTGGTVNQNVYGGGNAADALSDVTVTVTGGSMVDVYGGGKGETTVVGGDVTVNIGTKTTTGEPPTTTYAGTGEISGNVYGGSALGAVNATKTTVESVTTLSHTPDKETKVNIYAATTLAGSVFGGGLGQVESGTYGESGYKPAIAAQNFGNTTVTMENGTVGTAIYGGANTNGVLKGNSTVTITGGTIHAVPGVGDPIADVVFGGGFGPPTRVDGDVEVNIGTKTGTSPNEIYSGSATINGNVYGGSAEGTVNGTTAESNTHTTKVNLYGGDVRGTIYGGGLGIAGIAANVYGLVTVTTKAGTAQNLFGCNNVNGAPQQTVTVNIDGGTIGNVYGGGNQAAYLYANAATPQNLQVNISGGTMENVFGGGLSAEVAGGISVSVTGGQVNSDVYGGGALAHTNTANWDDSKYVAVPAANITNAVSLVTGLYTEDGGNYTEITTPNTRADDVTTYYQKGDWKTGIIDGDGKTTYKTIVSLTGGIVGNAYGGGLGRMKVEAAEAQAATYYTAEEATEYNATLVGALNSTDALSAAEATAYNAAMSASKSAGDTLTAEEAAAYNAKLTGAVKAGDLKTPATPAMEAVEGIAANVYGDVTVTVNGTAFTHEFVTPKDANGVVIPNALDVPITGRVFGCNNLNGTPMGNVLVEVDRTKRIEDDGTVSDNHQENIFEIHSVYGGGNLSHYQPATGKATKVIINGCDDTSIEKVFGGGNSASVPSTDVLILGTYYVGYAFSGGNGADMFQKENVWFVNDGAPVYGDATIIAIGGKIGQIFGGSDTKGTIYGNTTTKLKGKKGEDGVVWNGEGYSSSCTLRITNAYGAARGADIEGDVNFIISGCSAADEIERVFGGSYDANIRGGITLTITGGIFAQVFGGNDHGGTIGGEIKVDIEETQPECNPIVIQYLYGGGREAEYPGTGAKYITNSKDSEGNYIGSLEYHDFPYTSAGKNAKITVNVKSATRIDNIYGGCYRAKLNGDTEININMIKGNYVGKSISFPPTYRGDQIPNVDSPAGTFELVSGLNPSDPVTGLYTREELATEPVTYKYTRITDKDATAQGGTYYQLTLMTGTIKDDIGTIGNIFGGCFEGVLNGSTKVNIGTETNVQILKRDGSGKIVDAGGSEIYDSNGKLLKGKTPAYVDGDSPVLGAHITGNVFGGGENADVTGNTEVNICVKENLTTHEYEKVAEGTSGVSIGYACKSGVSIEGSSVYGISKYGSVFGGGCRGDVLGNTTVRMYDGYIFNGIYGGGFVSSVGTFTRDKTVKTDVGTDAEFDHSSHSGVCLGKPISCKVGTGLCTVVVKGGQIGPIDVATEGMERSAAKGGPVIEGWIWGAGEGEVDDPKVNPDTHFKSYVGRTDVTVGGDAFILESIIGGGEFGRVLDSTKVTIQDNCQIGVGYKQTTETVDGVLKPKRYTNDQFFDPIGKGESYINSRALNACSHYPYGRNTGTVENPNWVYDVQDPYADDVTLPGYEGASSSQPSDGRTWIGCVFGGGSGYVPYVKARNASTGKVTDYDWLPSAGLVEGNTWVDIQGGHILTNVYGGNEYTDVGGRSKVTMSGGTIGVPRSLDSIAAQPLICYLFGAGKGDQRAHFNTYTNVGSALVDVSGGIIYGSVFGGSEDGHVLGNVEVNIKPGAKIGTWGTSYVDGNIFGGGRGFSGETLGAGNVNGNITVNVTGGTMLGSIYGGGRMASVGTNFSQEQDPNKGQFIEDDDKGTHGHVTINISGGVIGNATPPADSDYSNSTHSGNVFGGSMGRLTLLNHEPNPLWTRLAQTKSSTINIDGNAIITRNVYGGAEFGTTRDNVNITIGSSGTPTINGSVFGGGLGSTEDSQEYNSTIIAGSGSSAVTYIFSPLQYAGCVGGNTNVTVKGGHVMKNVYGGGELASVGVIDLSVREDASGDITYDTKTYSYINAHKHADIADEGKTTEKVYGFGLSWPYEFSYILGGKATVNVTGGRIGTGYDNGTGYVFGGGKGQVAFKKKDGAALVDITDVHEQRYTEAFCANVRETEVNINYESTPNISSPQSIGAEDCIMGAVYGGGEDGHVYENTAITLEKGLIGLSIYGGGKGEGTYPGKLYALSVDGEGNLVPAGTKSDVPEMPSWTAGKVYGNTSITMEGGHVMGNVYGGGNLGSVGKGNYAGGTDDYYPNGYGETLQNAPLWTKTANFNPDNPITESNKPTSMADHFLSSGKCTVKITGGKVGTLNGLYGYIYGTTSGTPTGMVFGGSRGRAARDVGALSPRYNYAPDFFLGYANNTEVTIGTRNAATGPTIYSQVFGGGRDGHVRGSTHVIINNGTIGQAYDVSTDDYQRRHRGNVYGSGSGMGMWIDNDKSGHGTSSGSVTRNTTVDIYGGTIYNNVYGGGAMASVGPPQIPPSAQPASKTWSKCTVNIYGGTIGREADYEAHKYGGCVYGASRGGDNAEDESPDDYATTIWNDVNILPNPTDRSNDAVIAGDVYGGGEAGRVKKSNLVTLTGGIIKHDAYGGGKGTTAIAADVGGDATVELNGSTAANGTVTPVLRDKKGCVVNRIFGCNNINGSPKGHAKVHVHRTQNALKTKISEKFQPYHKYTPTNYADLLTDFDNIKTQLTELGVTIPSLTEYLAVLTTNASSSSDKQKQEAEENIKAVLSAKYDVQYVYGGGNLAMYVPTDLKTEYAEVIIDGCDLTSIYTAYGGGNAASTPANRITIWGTYEIDQVFGGGNGKDPYELDGIWYVNPGADVGYRDMTYFVTKDDTGWNAATHGSGTEADPYKFFVKTSPYDANEISGRQKANYPTGYMYGGGSANTDIYGGLIHTVYGGSNERGNIRTAAVSTYEEASECDMHVDYTYGAGKNAPIDGVVSVIMECVENIDNIYGGSTNADVLSDIHLQITNGTFKKVFGGNNTDGAIYGNITVDVEERGCQPIIIEELYAAGYLAPYSVYGYKKNADGTYERDAETGKLIPLKQGDAGALATPFFDPVVNVISATRIDNIYGGGFKAEVVGSPHVNVNMTNGMIKSRYVTDYRGTEKEIKEGNNIDAHGNTYTVTGFDASGNAILAIGTIGTIFGGGNEADIFGNTYVDIGTGEWLNEQRQRETLGTTADITTPTTFTYMKPTEDATSEVWTYQEKTTDPETEVVTYHPVAIVGNPTPSRNAATIKNTVYGGGNQGDVTGNTHVTMANGSVADRIYGGCDDGNVGTITEWETPEGHDSHANCIKKPKTWKEGTGKCTVTISGGKVGKDGMKMAHLDASGNLEKDDKGNPLPPDDYGYVFGAGRGVLDDPENDPDVTFKTYVYDTEVVIKNSYLAGHEGEAEYLTRPLILGGVYGGSENGRVRHDTDVKIQGGQIGVGIGMTEAYTEAQWTAAETAVRAIADATTEAKVAAAATAIEGVAMAECEHWPYGKEIDDGGITKTVYLPYDEHGDGTASSNLASDGHTFYGNVFGGGSGYFPYLKKNATPGVYGSYEWLESAGAVEGDTHVTISGGHVMTNVYGGNEVSSNTSTGTCYVTMTGGSLGVPRTLKQIDDHPVTCYLFGAGKGDQRTHFNKRTDVGNTEVTVSGGIIYGSIFGGGEDGHVLGNAKVTVQNTVDTTDPKNPVVTASPWIGTWGTSYVDGNVFGGGRGFSGDALTAGVVCGNVDMAISGGTMLGSIYGGGRLGSVGAYLASPTVTSGDPNPHYGALIPDREVEDNLLTEHVSIIPDVTHGYITVDISGGTIGNKYEFVNVPTNIEPAGLEDWENDHHIPKTEISLHSTEKDGANNDLYLYRLAHTKGGNVFTGGMGRRTQLDGKTKITAVDWTKLGNAKSTKLTISGDVWIMGNVYGGGEFGALSHPVDLTDPDNPVSVSNEGGSVEININGGTIGTEIKSNGEAPQKAPIDTPKYSKSGDSSSDVIYTFGSVFGGGYGTDVEHDEITQNSQVDKFGALVSGNTTIKMTAGHVRASVYGGGEMAAVGGNTNIDISGGEIGRNEVYGFSSGNPGYVRFGSSTMGNVFGGGMGESIHTLLGVVKGNTNITIEDTYDGAGNLVSSPKIYHNVYGGGAYGSVGSFIFSDGITDTGPFNFMWTVPKGIPLGWTPGTGVATVNIKGGTIGISGRDNGMVNGSARGDIAAPEPTTVYGVENGGLKDPYDKMAWVEESIVNIGETGKRGPHIYGSVYGGGENGHVFTHATVNVKSGTIGVVDEEDTWFDFGIPSINEKAWVTRGNVYGAGCGTDTYTKWTDSDSDGEVDEGETEELHNAWAGCVIGNTDVNISGGHIAQCVYGGGSMGSVGRIKNEPSALDQQHRDETNGFALSWPAVLEYMNLSSGASTGKATVNITGGRVGTTGSDNGDVFGGTRGETGDRYEMAPFANVRETEVNINYPDTPTDDDLTIVENIEDTKRKFSLRINEGVDAIAGSVYGGSENGHVNEDTHVTITNGLIGHAVYGGGKGKGTYMIGETEYPGLTSGKVYGNTYITMSGGHVMRNIFGGGNLGSVGKGNYASSSKDDYYPYGYGEKIDENLWTSSKDYDPDDPISPSNKPITMADYFLGSGKTNVNVTGGMVGFMAKPETAVMLLNDDNTTFTPSTYGAVLAGDKKKALIKVLSKDDLPTGNIFGGCRGQAAAEVLSQEDMTFEKSPYFFLGYVNETNVTIGDDDDGPVIYGSIYGGGQDGHVRRGTNVIINKGEIGVPYTADNQTIFGTDNLDDSNWLNRGNIYGGGSGIGMYDTGVKDDKGNPIEANSSSAGSVTHTASVTVNKGINGVAGTTTAGVYKPGGVIHRNVYGGGSQASVGPPTTRLENGPYPDDTHGLGRKFVNTVTISGTIGTPDEYLPGFKYNQVFGGEVYGACRGIKGLDPAYENYFGTSVWTKVLVKDGARILNNVFGGGDSGKVLKDTDVIIGAE